MTITPREFVEKEFPDLSGVSLSDWLRKMQEFAVLQNSKVNLDHLLEIKGDQLNALNSAVSALYFADNKDYKNALFSVVRHLSKIDFDVLDDEVVRAIYYLLNSDS